MEGSVIVRLSYPFCRPLHGVDKIGLMFDVSTGKETVHQLPGVWGRGQKCLHCGWQQGEADHQEEAHSG